MTDKATISQASVAVLFAPDKATVCSAHAAILLGAETPTHIGCSIDSLLGSVSSFVSGPVEFILSTSSLLGPVSSFTSTPIEITSSVSFLLGEMAATISGPVEINTSVTDLLGVVTASAFSPVEQNILVSSLLGVANFFVSPDVEINLEISDLLGHVVSTVSPDCEVAIDLTSLLGSVTTYFLGAHSDYDNRAFLPGYDFDGTWLYIPIAALPGLSAEHVALVSGDLRWFLWYWNKRVWAWTAERTYIDTSLLCIPVSNYETQSTEFPTSVQERYYFQVNGPSFSELNWSSRAVPNDSDANWWKVENLFSGWQCDGVTIKIPLSNIVGLTAEDADPLVGNCHALIRSMAQNAYDWRRKLPWVAETITINKPDEIYDYSIASWWSTFDQYLYIDAYGNLPAGNLVGE